MDTNKRPDTMERITTKALADQFIKKGGFPHVGASYDRYNRPSSRYRHLFFLLLVLSQQHAHKIFATTLGNEQRHTQRRLHLSRCLII